MRRAVAIAVACTAAAAVAEPADRQAEVTEKVKGALAHHDAAALAAALTTPLTYEGLATDAPACQAFVGGGTVTKPADLAAFATCLVSIADVNDVRAVVEPGASAASHLVITPRPDSDPAADAVAATLAKAIQANDPKAVAAALDAPLYYTGLVSKQRDCGDSGHVQDRAVLESFASCLLGVDGIADYGVVGHLYPPSSRSRAAEHAVHVFVDPATHAVKTLVFFGKRDPNAPQIVAPAVLNGNRISGDPYIRPDDKTAIAIHKSGKPRVIASVKLCLEETGDIASVHLLRSSGFAAYDQEIVDAIHTWTYRPWLVDGKPTAVCTAITFIYQQH